MIFPTKFKKLVKTYSTYSVIFKHRVRRYAAPNATNAVYKQFKNIQES